MRLADRRCTWLRCMRPAVRELTGAMALCDEHGAHLQAAVDAGQPAAGDALRLAAGLPISRCEVRDGVLVCY